jgi:hypothetical protein
MFLPYNTLSKKLIKIDQCAILYPLLKRFGITSTNLGYFILDNTPNNNITLVELRRRMNFEPKNKQLQYIRHIINFIAEAYLFGQNTFFFDEEFKRARLEGCR